MTETPKPSKLEGVAITFQDVGYSVPDRKKKQEMVHLLSGVTGNFKPGTITAVMGPSGAGKTTFLDIVTGRKTRGKIVGDLLFDGALATPSFLRRETAYVEQFDTLLAVLTVKDMLLYQAELKCDRRESSDSKAARVEKLIDELGLRGCADVHIGDSLNRGISGGQAKRTNIGIALVTEPRAIFLDEPTSGLDSQTSCDVVSILRKLADQGRTIMSTIHSPTSEAFRMFDRLLLLYKGETVYFGTLHGDGGTVPYFAERGIKYDPNTNLADFLIAETGEKGEAQNFPTKWKESQRQQSARAECEQMVKDYTGISGTRSSANVSNAIKEPLYHTGFTAVVPLMKFRTKANYRFPDFVMPRIMPNIFFGFIVATVYWKAGEEGASPEGIAARGNMASALFMLVAMPAFTASGYIPSIVGERALFYREHSDGCYTTFAYLLFKMIEEAIPQVFGSLIMCTITFFSVDFPGSFLWHWAIYFITSQVGIVLAYFCASVAPNMDAANTLLPIINVTSMFFTGVLMTYDDIPNGWKWYPWTTFMRYAWCAHMLNNFEPECENVEYENTPGCPIEYWGLKKGSAGLSAWKNFLALVAFWGLWTLMAFLALKYVRHVKR